MARPHLRLPVLTPQEIQRFWSKVQINDSGECWPWMAYRNLDGYGCVTIQKTQFFAHRIAYYISRGIDPIENLVCHTCDNPPCCNPEHYFLGDNQVNLQDAAKKKRMASGTRNGTKLYPERVARGEQASNAKQTEDRVRQIRQMYQAGMTLKEIGAALDMSFQTVWDIVARRTWKHVN